MKELKKEWKYDKYIRKSVVTFAEYICLTSTITPTSSNYIYNLTRHKKLNDQIFIKSSKHIPLPSTSIPTITVRNALVNFENSLRWRIFFKFDGPNPKYNPKFKIIPKQNVREFPEALDYMNTDNSIIDLEINKLHKNLTPILNQKTEYKLKRKSDQIITNLLKEFPDITICLTDKNLGFAALQTTHYEELAFEHLNNPQTYQKCHQTINQITLISLNNLKKFNKHFKKYLNPSEKDFLKKQIPLPITFPTFKALPKVHKKGKLKARPIVTSFNWYTRPIALILNERIKKLNIKLPFVLKSSYELIPQLPRNLLEEETLVTIDIKSMYPSIDQNMLSQALTQTYKADPLLPKLLDFILTNSYCKFKNEPYLQIQGIPMGDNASVSLANLFCDTYLDRRIFKNKHIKQYYRYIDDIFLIWTGPRIVLDLFIENINSKSSLTLEIIEYSNTKVNYLDITIYKEYNTNRLFTSLYHKPISKFTYLSPSSCHPPHILSGWIYAEITRYYRLTTNPTRRSIQLIDFKKKLLTRGYKYSFLNPIFVKAHKKHLLPKLTKTKTNPKMKNKLILPFVLPYYPDYRSLLIFNTIKNGLKRITNKLLPDHKPILVHSTLNPISAQLKRKLPDSFHQN